jgi:hypothetical protein
VSDADPLAVELDRLVAIDEQRNEHTQALAALQSRRDVQIGRMQVIAEQAGVNLEGYVTEALAQRTPTP